MKTGKTTLFAVLLTTALTIGLAAQTAADFRVELTADSSGLRIKGYTGRAVAVRVPATIEGLPVKEIEEMAFRGNSTITPVTLPDGLVKIGADAFAVCTTITTVEIPEGVTEIGERAFNGCKALTSVSLPSTIKKIEPYAFAYCSALTTVTIPDSVKTIEFKKDMFYYQSDAFQGCVRMGISSQAAIRKRGYMDHF